MAKIKELQGLRKREVFDTVLKDEVFDGTKILGCTFVLLISNKDSNEEVYKAQCGVQGPKIWRRNLFWTIQVIWNNVSLVST